MGSFSLMHWLVVLLIVVVLFGPKRLPELGSGLGKAISNFKQGLKEGEQLAQDSKAQLPPTDSEKK